MRSFARVMLISLALSAGFLVAGCDTLEGYLDFLDTKKKLPGDRKPVFPEGVPGVTQGIPPELMQGYQEPQQSPAANATPDAGAQPKTSAEAKPPEKAEAAAKPKPKPKPAQVARPQPKPQSAPAEQAASPPQAPAAQTASGQTQPWPTSQPQTGWPAPQPQAAWPTAPSR